MTHIYLFAEIHHPRCALIPKSKEQPRLMGKNGIFQAKKDATNKLLPELKPPAATKWVHWTQKVEEKLASSRESNPSIKEKRFCRGSIKWIKYTPENLNMELGTQKKRRFGRFFSFSNSCFSGSSRSFFPEGTSQSHHLILPCLHGGSWNCQASQPSHPRNFQQCHATICDQENTHDTILTQFFQLINRSRVFSQCVKSSRIYSNDGDILPFFAALKDHITGWVPHADGWVPFPPHRDVGRPGGTQLEQNFYQRKKNPDFEKMHVLLKFPVKNKKNRCKNTKTPWNV